MMNVELEESCDTACHLSDNGQVACTRCVSRWTHHTSSYRAASVKKLCETFEAGDYVRSHTGLSCCLPSECEV